MVMAMSQSPLQPSMQACAQAQTAGLAARVQAHACQTRIPVELRPETSVGAPTREIVRCAPASGVLKSGGVRFTGTCAAPGGHRDLFLGKKSTVRRKRFGHTWTPRPTLRRVQFVHV